MKKIITILKFSLNEIIDWVCLFGMLFIPENDPVYNCELYLDKGCSHVDGFLCDHPHCSMNKKYMESKTNADS